MWPCLSYVAIVGDSDTVLCSLSLEVFSTTGPIVGNSLVVHWLGLSAFTVLAWVQSLVREPRSCKPCKKKPKTKTVAIATSYVSQRKFLARSNVGETGERMAVSSASFAEPILLPHFSLEYYCPSILPLFHSRIYHILRGREQLVLDQQLSRLVT